MKKIIIGSVLFLSGIIVSMGVLNAAVMLLPTVGSWSGSRLLTVISVKELGLPFTLGILLCLLGFVILLNEYFRKRD